MGAVLAFSVACGCGSSGSSGGSPDGGAGQGGSSGSGGAGGAGGVAGAAAAGGGSGVGGSSGGGGGTGGHSVSGTVSLVNPGSGTSTGVIIAPSSFNPDAPSLVAPAGPKATGVTGSWSIPNVPDGQYTVLVAWENDGLVLDPDPAVGGTKLVVIDVAGADVDAGSFKVTGALEVVSPNDGAQATLPLTFKWKDVSGEDHYELRVYDQSGSVVHTNLAIPAVSGSSEVVASYNGGALTSGATYQFRAVAVTAGGAPMTRTENLRGVFIAP